MNRIVLGYDASPAAERALERVVELATIFDASVIAASIAPARELVPGGVENHSGPVQPAAPHDQVARDVVAKLSEQGISARPAIGLGNTSQTLVRLAEASDADLVVVGMGSSHLLAQMLEAVYDDGADEAHCDVLLVR